MATFEELMAKSRELAAAGNTADARRVAQIALKVRAGPQTNMVEQAGIGVNEGLANMAGLPVDLVTGAINAGTRGINAVAGTDIPRIENPAGGSAHLNQLRQQALRDVPAQNRGQRYARRAGQEVGASAIPGGVAMRSAQAPMQVAAMTGASALGSGVAGQTSREVMPDSDLADFVASVLGGGAVPAAAHMMKSPPRGPSLQQLKQERDAYYDAVNASGARLSPQSSDALAGSIEGTFGPRVATRKLNPKANVAATDLAEELRTAPPTISEVDETRRWIGQNVAGSREPGEARLGMKMKGAIDDHLANLQPADVTGTNRPEQVVSDLVAGRDRANRIYKSQLFEAEDVGAFDKGMQRAASTGTGGNQVNAIRQNVRTILQNPKLRKGYNEAELQAMRDIVNGTPPQNAMRWLSKFAPSSGYLPGVGAAASVTAAVKTGQPLLALPSAAGEAAKFGAEYSTKRQIKALGELVRNGKPLPKKEVGDSTKRALAVWLASRAASAPEPTGKTKELMEALLARR